jgi:hypothetical protein
LRAWPPSIKGGHIGPPLQENCRLTAMWYQAVRENGSLKMSFAEVFGAV